MRPSTMKKGLLIIAHGSPLPQANEEFKTLCCEVETQLPEFKVAAAFLEKSMPNISSAFETLAQFVDTIMVLPYFLVRGKHTQTDIPRIIEECSKIHPHIKVTSPEPLGVHPSIVELLVSIARS